MKKLIIFSLILFFTKPLLFAQVIKLENGVVASSMSDGAIDVLNKKIITYSALIGMDYWETKSFYLSSQVGYLRKGGKEENPLLSGDQAKFKEAWNYIHLNTTMRFPFKLKDNTHIFIGIGPKMDFLVGSEKFKSSLYSSGFKMNTTTFGGKAEMGLVHDFDKYRIGINFSYLHDLTTAASTEFMDLKNNAFSGMLSVGYRL
ncbi:outer membrane beta-barrel protein [Aquimarina sp. I32.4]|uniref:outer membrane beta-barrel protein n=1 Tax=Aquimarina sp. I32.4 TaxID=2053903 RepID=UPI000CDE6845|nr:outer membrane beta-barrel protein [Aquimarina sp. I32.4]